MPIVRMDTTRTVVQICNEENIMKKTILALALSLIASTVAVTSAAAQIGFAGEGRLGVTFPTGDLSSDGAEAGLSMGAELQMNFQTNLTAYLGLHRHGFNCDSDCEVGDSPRSTGLNAGLKYIFPSPPDVLVWGRGGLVANQLSTDSGSGPRNLGFEVGAGFDMPIAPNVYLVPNLGFVSHDAGSGMTAQFFTFGLGLHYHFN